MSFGSEGFVTPEGSRKVSKDSPSRNGDRASFSSALPAESASPGNLIFSNFLPKHCIHGLAFSSLAALAPRNAYFFCKNLKIIEVGSPSEVIVELAWDIPMSNVVSIDFWMSSGDQEAADFLASMKPFVDEMKSGCY